MSEDSNLPEVGILQQKFDLHASPEVQFDAEQARLHGEQVDPSHKQETVGHYLANLATRHSMFTTEMTDGVLRRKRQIEHYIIKDEDMPEAYFDKQRRIAREQGHGDFEIDSAERLKAIRVIQKDQANSLGSWVSYLGDKDATFPEWFKYYTLRSVVKLAAYDKQKHSFQTRTKATIAPFPDLNREALAYVYDSLQSNIKGTVPSDQREKQLVQGANFGKLYAYAIENVTPASKEQRSATVGSWVKYNQSDDPTEANKLAKSLQGHGTGWCTAGESTAAEQLKAGDFYVYYSVDEKGNDTVPRLAIRMEDDRVAEVRGISGNGENLAPGENSNQEVEPVMLEIVQDKVKQLPGGTEYAQIVADMKDLSILEKRLTDDPSAKLSSSELRFLYETDKEIQGFGYQIHERVAAIQELRNVIVDLRDIYQTDSLDNVVAHQMIDGEGGGLGLLTNNLAYFKGLDNVVAHAILTQRDSNDIALTYQLPHLLAANLPVFADKVLDDEIVSFFLQEGLVQEAAEYVSKFTDEAAVYLKPPYYNGADGWDDDYDT